MVFGNFSRHFWLRLVDIFVLEKPKHDDEAEDHGSGDGYGKSDDHVQDDASLESLIDPILELMDKDKDGYITYAEYKTAELEETNTVSK